MKEEIKKLLESYPKIEAVLSYANQADIKDKNQALNRWIWQLRDAIDEADDLLDDFEYMRHKKQLATNMPSFKSLLFATSHQLGKVGKRALKIDPILKKLEEVVQKLDRVSSDVTLFFHLIDRAQLEQQKQLNEFQQVRETSSFPTENLIGRVKDKESIMEWLNREPSNEEHPTDVSGTITYHNISLLSIVGNGGLGKTTLVQHVYKDKMTDEFDLKMWVSVSNNFDVQKVIIGMLKSLEESKIDSKETRDSKIDSKEARDSKIDSKEARDSKIDSKEARVSKIDSMETRDSKIYSKEARDSKIDSKEARVSKINSMETRDSKIDSKEKRDSKIDSKEKRDSKIDSKETRDSKIDSKETRDSKIDSMETLETLISKLQYRVKSKKFLLVLDDVWGENQISNWQKVFSGLAHGGLGSKILVTTRMDSVASMFAKVIKKKKETKGLEGLKESECMNILTTHAFAGGENPNDHKKLIYIAKMSVEKLSGSPLVAKVVGVVLNIKLDERHWRNVLNNNLNPDDISSILKLSYIFLPKHLQNCFSFCSIFSQDYEFDKDDLVRMWIAVGFIRPSKTPEETLEDIGQRYFDALVNKSFFEKVDRYYKMHGFLHDLAKNVSEQECFRDDGKVELLLTIPETIRHLSIKFSSLKVLKKMKRFKNLRTLRITDFDNLQDNADTLNEFCKVTRSIRLLELQSNWFYEIDRFYEIDKLKAIKYLKHLRFLRCEFPVTRLPRYLTKLYHLQFIIYDRHFSSDSDKDDFFPSNMNNLSNLRYMSYTDRLKFFGIGKLKFLQEVEGFYVENEIGYRIEELNHMNDLCILGINQLENMRDATEACNAKLFCKKKLTNLSLNWSVDINGKRNIVNPDLDDESVLDNLQPHNCLKELNMNNYMGVRSAVWMKEAHLINNLEEINLCNCLEWKILPPFGHLPFLKILRLENMPKVKWVDNDKYCDFQSLEEPHISDARVDCLFPSLTALGLYNCPNLQELPYLPPKLETLDIDNIGWKTLNCCSVSKSIPLKELFVRRCRNITFISMVGEIGTVAMLKIVKIEDCPNSITFLGLNNQEVETTKNCQLIIDRLIISNSSVLQMELLRSVTSVRELTIKEEDELISFPFEAERCLLQVSSSIRHLKFKSLRSLQSLPSILTSISSLEILKVSDLPQLQELPNLPASLEQLELLDLESLQCLSPSLSTISSLKYLHFNSIPLLKSLPELPPSLCGLYLISLDNLEYLPSCLSNLSFLTTLYINEVPLLRELPNLPPSMKYLDITDCHPNLEKLCDLT